jgi:hypothetical protein
MEREGREGGLFGGETRDIMDGDLDLDLGVLLFVDRDCCWW